MQKEVINCEAAPVQTVPRGKILLIDDELKDLSVLNRAMQVDRGTPVLVLARCLNLDCYLESIQMGAVDYLEKPVAPEEMARVVRNHLRPRAAA